MCIFSPSLQGLDFSQKPDPMIRTGVCNRQIAKISEVHENHGFLDFKVPEKYHRLSISKNGAPILPTNDGRLFFYKNDLFACIINELKPGLAVTFNVIHSKTSNKYIATRVKPFQDQICAKTVTPVCENQTAVISSLSDQFGFVNFKLDEIHVKLSLAKNGAPFYPENNGTILFHRNGLFGCCMADLKIGAKVNFDVVHNKKSNRFMATKLTPVLQSKALEFAKNAILTKPKIRSNAQSVDRRPSIIDKLTIDFEEIRRASIDAQMVIFQSR